MKYEIMGISQTKQTTQVKTNDYEFMTKHYARQHTAGRTILIPLVNFPQLEIVA
jgi:hypothetical protein